MRPSHFFGGIIVLRRYDELMRDADPTIRALWVWHQVEEVEHGSVAFDFYRAFYPDSDWYRRWMVVFAYGHIVWETAKAYAEMIKREGYYRRPGRAFRAWRFFLSFGIDLGVSALPVLSSRYHPRNHPACTSQLNPLTRAWKKFDAEGNDVHRLGDEKIERMMVEMGDP